MRKRQKFPAAYWLPVAAALTLLLVFPTRGVAAQDPWPKRFEHEKCTVIMYQPQLETFKDDDLTARAAVSVKTKDMKAPVFGAVWLLSDVSTDRDSRMATIYNVKVTDAKFPSAADAKPEQIERLKTFLNAEMASWRIPLSLDRMLAALEVAEKAHAADQGLRNDPPKIIFTTHPTVLVSLDGDPKLLPVPKSSLMRVANTPFLMFYEPAAKAYYLRGGDTWLSAADLKGPWESPKALPASLKALQDEILKAEKAKGKAAAKEVEAAADEKMPAILVSTVTAELLVTQGEPQYTPISGTNLLYVSNTESHIFMDTASQEYYALLSGRWFKTKSLAEGPWAYVAPNQLPADFAKIPEDSVKGFVLVSVAGTRQAQEAVLDNVIPQTAEVNRKTATTKVEYAGEPKFEKIADTDLEYAVNTGKSVFKEGAKYYAVDQGVWYESDSPNGPWKASVSPPKQVDRIPPSNPNFNAKYVKVYDSTDDTVTVGYTPGYTGSYVDNGTVVYGTGYSYPAYSTPTAYIPAPVTYGYAATYNPYAGNWGYQPSYYNPASWLVPGLVGFAAGAAVAAATTPWWGHGWWGGGWWGAGGYNNVNITNIHNNVYRRGQGPYWRDHGGRPIHHPVVNPRPNLYNRAENRHNLASHPQRPATRPASQARPGTGQRPGQAAKPGARPDRPVQAAKPGTKPTQPRAAGGKNNVLADKSGHVYRRDNQGNWQQRQGNQWSKAGDKPGGKPTAASRPATRPERQAAASRPTQAARASTASRPDTNRLNQDFQARQRGQARTQNFQRAQSPRPSASASRPSGGGGGHRGGGGRSGGGGGRRR